MASKCDISIWLGNNTPRVTWKWPDGFDLTDSKFKLFLWDRTGSLILEVDSDTNPELSINTANGEVYWEYTIDQSRLIPKGGLTRYELERRWDIYEKTVAYGTVTGKGGDNTDG